MTDLEVIALSQKLNIAKLLKSQICETVGRINALKTNLNITQRNTLNKLEGEKHYKYFLGKNADEEEIKELGETAIKILTKRRNRICME